MLHRLLYENHGQRTPSVVLLSGDRISAAQISAIGAFADATLRDFGLARKHYVPNLLHDQVKVASMIGHVALSRVREATLYIDVVVRDEMANSGHLRQARVRPTLKVTLAEPLAQLQRALDPESGLALIRPRQ